MADVTVSQLHAVSYGASSRWRGFVYPIYFQCTDRKFIRRSDGDLGWNNTCVCHMSSTFTGVLMLKRSKSLKTRTGSLGKEENWEGTQILIVLSCPHSPSPPCLPLSHYELCLAALSPFLVFRDSAPWLFSGGHHAHIQSDAFFFSMQKTWETRWWLTWTAYQYSCIKINVCTSTQVK